MRGTTARLLAVLLAAVLVSGLTACGSKEKEAYKVNWVTAPAYTAEDVSVPVDTGTFCGCCAGEGCMYILAAGDGEQLPSLYRVPLDGGEPEKMEEFYLLDSREANYAAAWRLFMGGDGKLWIWEQYTVFYYDLPEDFDGDNDYIGRYMTGQDEFYHLRQLDPRTGRKLQVVDVGELAAGWKRSETLQGLAVDSQGTIYVGTNRKITALDGEGTTLFTLNPKLDNAADGTLALLPDGTAIALVHDAAGNQEVRSINPAGKTWGEVRYNVTAGTTGIISGSAPYQFFCQRNNTLYGRLEGEALDQRLLRWEDAGLGIGSGVECFALLDSRRAAVLTADVPEGGSSLDFQIRLQILTPSDKLPSSGKIRLVYGTIGDDGWARMRVNQFNAANDKYYIELRDYAEGMLDSHASPDYNQIRDAAVTRLTAEILAGRIPDILDDREIPLSALAGQGVLADLWPFIDGDPELGRDRLMTHVLDCAETDGKLYQVFSNFRIKTIAASADIAGDRTAWTLQEMTQAYGGTMPEICQFLTGAVNPVLLSQSAEGLLYSLLYMDLGRFVDWSSGECFFDTEDFRDILRLCAAQGERDMEKLQPLLWDGRPIVAEQLIGSMTDLAQADAAFGGPEALMDYEARLAENGITSHRTKVDGEWVGVTDSWLGEVERAREEGRIFSTEMAADFISGALARGGCAAYPGYPAGSGAGSCFVVQDCLAIAEACQAKEGAWEFVRQLLRPGGDLSSGRQDLWTTYDAFPINRADFEELLEPQWFVDDDGEHLLDGNGERIEKAAGIFVLGDPGVLLVFERSPTRTQMERFWDLYHAIDRVNSSDREMMQIIREQAQPYFAGDKSLDEVTDLIQRRVSLYVNENR